MSWEKVSRGQDDDYTTGWLLDFGYFNNNKKKNKYRLIAADLSRKKP